MARVVQKRLYGAGALGYLLSPPRLKGYNGDRVDAYHSILYERDIALQWLLDTIIRRMGRRKVLFGAAFGHRFRNDYGNGL